MNSCTRIVIFNLIINSQRAVIYTVWDLKPIVNHSYRFYFTQCACTVSIDSSTHSLCLLFYYVLLVIWTPYDWLSKFYSFHMAALVGIVSKCSLRIEVYHKNQPNESELAQCKLLIHFNSYLKLLYINDKMEHFSYEVVCVAYMGLHVSRHLNYSWLWYR